MLQCTSGVCVCILLLFWGMYVPRYYHIKNTGESMRVLICDFVDQEIFDLIMYPRLCSYFNSVLKIFCCIHNLNKFCLLGIVYTAFFFESPRYMSRFQVFISFHNDKIVAAKNSAWWCAVYHYKRFSTLKSMVIKGNMPYNCLQEKPFRTLWSHSVRLLSITHNQSAQKAHYQGNKESC